MNLYDILDKDYIEDLNTSITNDAVQNYYDKAHLDDGTIEGRNRRRMSLWDIDGKFSKSIYQGRACRAISRWNEIEDIIQKEANSYANSISPYPVKDNSYWNCWSWFNVIDCTDHYAWHAHNKYFLSSAYYPDEGDGSTPIIFKSPLSDMINTWWPAAKFGTLNRWGQEVVIYPKKGDLLIFPAWLEHTVNKPHHGLGRELMGHSFGHVERNVLPPEDPSKLRVSLTCNFRNEHVVIE